MFFSFSLATYYTCSSLYRNCPKFLGYGRAQYILPPGSFGKRPSFQDFKRKPPSREFPAEDVSLLLSVTQEPTLFLDKIHNNFLGLTLIEQQEIFVDFLLIQFEDCLTGLASNISIKDVGRLRGLKNSNDPNTSYRFKGNFGSLLLSSDRPFNANTTKQLLPTINLPRRTAFNVSANAVATKEYFPTLLLQDVFTNNHSSVGHTLNYTICLPATFSGYSYPLVRASCNQSLSDAGSRCTKNPHEITSAPAFYRTVVQHNAASMKVSFCRRVVQCVTYRSTPVTLRVTKISLTTERNCVSLIIYKANHPVVVRRGLIHEEKRRTIHPPLPSHQKLQDIISSTNDATPEPLPVCDHHLTLQPPKVPVLPWANRTLGGKAAAALPSETDFTQHNQQTDAAKNQNTAVPQVRIPGQNSNKLSSGAVGAVGGHADTNIYNPFGWGPTANLGFYWPFENKPGREATQNPVVGVIGGKVNKHPPTCNTIVPGLQAAATGTVWNTSKPCSRRNTDVTSYGNASSHHLLNSRKSNQRAATPLFNTINNFGLGTSNQAAGPGFMLWGANPVIPRSLMKAIPKALAKGSPVDGNNNVVHKYKLPSSCKVIRWSDLEEVNDRRTNMPKTLGSGGFGVVKLMRQTSSGRLCAVKINRDNIDKQTAIENFKLEVGVLSLLKDLDCVPDLLGITTPDTYPHLPVVVQEFIGDPNTLRSVTLLYALQAKVLPAPKAIRVALRVCEAVKEIHSRKLLHCDLKTDNIMLEPNFIREDNPKIKIIDFGLAVKMDDTPKYQYNSRADIPWILTNCIQVAPEVVRGEKPYNVSSEVYSLGMIFKHLSYRFGGFLQNLGEDCRNLDYHMRPSLEEVIQRIQAHLASNQL